MTKPSYYRSLPSAHGQYRVIAEVWDRTIDRYHPTQGWRTCPDVVSEVSVLDGLESRADARMVAAYLNARERTL